MRVYPDKIHTDTHEPELTEDELTWGKAFLGANLARRQVMTNAGNSPGASLLIASMLAALPGSRGH